MARKSSGDKPKKSGFSLDNYKTHNGPQGSTEQWKEAMRKALMLENPQDTAAEIEIKLTRMIRKITV